MAISRIKLPRVLTEGGILVGDGGALEFKIVITPTRQGKYDKKNPELVGVRIK